MSLFNRLNRIKNSITLCNKKTGVDIVVPNCFKFVCESKGSFGCFLGITKTLNEFFITNVNSYTMVDENYNNIDNDTKIELFNYLHKENIYIKIFNQKDYNTQLNADKEVIELLGNELIKSHTNFEFYNTSNNTSAGFYLIFNNNLNIVLHGKTISDFGIIMYKKFGTDLSIIQPNTFNYKKFIDDIYPIMFKLHQNNKYHGDIKEENIVYNTQSKNIKYKLIDFNLSGKYKTPNYILPYMLHSRKKNIYLYINSTWLETYPDPKFNIFKESYTIFHRLFYTSSPRATNIKINKLLQLYNIKDTITYLNIKSDDYAIAVVLFNSIKDKIGNLTSEELAVSKYKDIYLLINDLLSINPFFLAKEREKNIDYENARAVSYFNKIRSNSFGGVSKKYKVNNPK